MTEVLSGLDSAERARVAALRAQGSFFWLDVSLSETSRDDVVEALGIRQRALDGLPGPGDENRRQPFHANGESVGFALRCDVSSESPSDESDYRLRPLEVRVVVTSDCLVTLHAKRLSLPAVLAPDLVEERSRAYVVYAVLAAMVESTLDALGEIELKLEGLAAIWAEGSAGAAPRAALRAAGARLANVRRWVTAEQAVIERSAVAIGALARFDRDEPYFDRLDEEVDRLVASIDAAAEAMGMLLDLQLNERAYVVSVVATIFVPLTFVTGFFGMNFGWMIDRIGSPLAFWLLGMAVPIATAALSWRFLLRRFLAGDDQRTGSR